MSVSLLSVSKDKELNGLSIMDEQAENTGHFDLLFDVGEMASLLAGSRDISSFLSRTVERIAQTLTTDVCSIYLFNDTTNRLELRATYGLADAAVGTVRLALGEGIVGKALADGRPGPGRWRAKSWPMVGPSPG